MKDQLTEFFLKLYLKMVLQSAHWFSSSLEYTTYMGVSDEINTCAIAAAVVPVILKRFKKFNNSNENE